MPAKKRSSSTCPIGLIQMRCTAKVEQNIRHAEALVAEAAKKGARLVCLPELFASLYFCQSLNPDWFKLAEPIPGPLTQRFCKLAKKHRIVLLVPIFEKAAPGLYFNSCAVIDANGGPLLVAELRELLVTQFVT